MKVLATVLMASALMAGCSMPGFHRTNAVQGNNSEATKSMQYQNHDMSRRGSMTDHAGTTQRRNAINGDASEVNY